jgi:hypothetical protein
MSYKPLGDRPMTNAERQARHRAARAAGLPVIRYRRAADRRSRAQRWRDAVAELLALQAEYAAWLDALSETLRDGGATGQALQAIVDLDLDDILTIGRPSSPATALLDQHPAIDKKCSYQRGAESGRHHLVIPGDFVGIRSHGIGSIRVAGQVFEYRPSSEFLRATKPIHSGLEA